jgi:hypothetical protein
MQSKLMIRTNEVSLEAEIFESNNETSEISVLLCHPHPQFLLDIPKKGKIRWIYA